MIIVYGVVNIFHKIMEKIDTSRFKLDGVICEDLIDDYLFGDSPTSDENNSGEPDKESPEPPRVDSGTKTADEILAEVARWAQESMRNNAVSPLPSSPPFVYRVEQLEVTISRIRRQPPPLEAPRLIFDHSIQPVKVTTVPFLPRTMAPPKVANHRKPVQTKSKAIKPTDLSKKKTRGKNSLLRSRKTVRNRTRHSKTE